MVDSIDISDYENATIEQDMNQPIPEHLKLQYDTVIDRGSLEHIFNFPVSIKNCMSLIKPGGFYIGITLQTISLVMGFINLVLSSILEFSLKRTDLQLEMQFYTPISRIAIGMKLLILTLSEIELHL